MATKTRQLTDEVLAALSSIEWDGNTARMTCGQLDRKTYVAVNDALETLGGKWSKKDNAHVFSAEAADQLDAIIATGSYESVADTKQLLGIFETPPALARAAAEMLSPQPGGYSLLEPSAGGGNLIQAALAIAPDLRVIAVEVQPEREAVLRPMCDEWRIADFLELGDRYFERHFDYVLMNPPFARQADIAHVLHAWDFLKDGGTLVAIMSSAVMFRENTKSKEFRCLIKARGEYHLNPEGSFKESGTMVNTIMVKLVKPK